MQSKATPIIKSKAQEIEALRAFAAHIEPGDYLAALFTSELLDWAQREIEGDNMPALFSAYIAYQTEASAQATEVQRLIQERDQAEADIQNLNLQIEEMKEAFARHKQENTILQSKADYFSKQLKAEEEQNATNLETIHELENRVELLKASKRSVGDEANDSQRESERLRRALIIIQPLANAIADLTT